MMNVQGYGGSVNGYYANELNNRQKLKNEPKTDEKSKTEEAKPATKSNESALSDKAKDLLEKIRNDNKDVDFFVANNDSEMEGLFAGSTKAFSVGLSNEELEKMAEDEDYAREMLDKAGSAMDMSDRITEQLGLNDKDISLAKLGITFGEDGKLSLFAELEKTGETQKDQLNRTSVTASSEEELLENISKIDWNALINPESMVGVHFDSAV